MIHIANDTVLIDRLQTAGPGSVSIRRETIYELGNYLSVGQITDIPDLSFSMESFDVTCEMEAFLLKVPVNTTHTFDVSRSKVVNIKSAFKPGKDADNAFQTVDSAAIPCLRLEQLQYRFGVGNQSAQQTASLKGDTLFYNPGSTYIQEVAGSGVAGQTVVLTNPSYAIVEGGVERRTLAATAGNRRLNYGSDYTETVGSPSNGAATVTVTITDPVLSTETIAVTYASPTAESFPQSVHALVSGVSGTLTADATSGATSLTVSSGTGLAAGQAVILDDGTVNAEVVIVGSVTGTAVTLTAPTTQAHTSGDAFAVYAPTVKPAAIRGRDIDVFIGLAHPSGTDKATARGPKRSAVQTVEASWRVTLENDEEMGNYHYVEVSPDVPQVSGTVAFRPATPGALLTLMQDLSGEANRLRSAQSTDSPLMDVQIAIKNPVDGRVLKRLHIPDARFSLPGYSARVQQKLDLSAAFQSDQGLLYVYDN